MCPYKRRSTLACLPAFRPVVRSVSPFTLLWTPHHSHARSLTRKICEAVRDGGGVVWANTEVQEGLLGRSDLPLRTAVGAPVYTHGRELGVLVLFSPSLIQNSASTMEFLYTLAQAASAADTTDAFLPALASSFPVGPPPPPPTVALRASASWRRGSAQNRLRRLDALRASLPVDVMFQTLAMGQTPNPERSLRAVRSVYNDHSGRVVIGAGGTIPAEFFRPGGGGLVVGNGGHHHHQHGFVSSGALTASDPNTRGTPGAGGGSGSGSGSNTKRPMSPLTLGGGRAGMGGGSGGGRGMMLLEDGGGEGAGAGGGGGGGSSGGVGNAAGLGWLVLPGEDGVSGGSGGGGGGAQTPLRRGSFQSNASVDFGLSFGAEEVKLCPKFLPPLSGRCFHLSCRGWKHGERTGGSYKLSSRLRLHVSLCACGAHNVCPTNARRKKG